MLTDQMYGNPENLISISKIGSVRNEDGGMKYDVVLQEARTKKIPRPKSAPSARANNQEIQQKLKVNFIPIDRYEGNWNTNQKK